MMFEFRVYSKEEKKITYFYNISSLDLIDSVFEETQIQGDVIMQNTGLKDKNGKEIYEGDIIEIHSRGIDFIFLIEEINLKYQNGLKGKLLKNSEWEHLFYSPFWEESEIIGNMYENPELLKKKR